VATESGEYPADIVFVGLGMDPRSELAEAAGLPIGRYGGILTDPTQRVEGYDNIWSGGDCTEVVDRLTGERRYLPLGTHANKHGRVIGLNIVGRSAEFPGVIGTAITKFQDLEIARVGLQESEALDAGRDVATVTISATTKAGYMPGADPIRIKMLADRADGRVIGTQIIGGDGAGKRIDTAATAIWAGLTVADVVDMDLSYAPPFSPVWDPIQVAARALLPQL
jgi:NADPH-dependent 2,4-dienoyl-CoA reductase/sulfur reductase-like enzyme